MLDKFSTKHCDVTHSARSAWIETVYAGIGEYTYYVALRKECVD